MVKKSKKDFKKFDRIIRVIFYLTTFFIFYSFCRYSNFYEFGFLTGSVFGAISITIVIIFRFLSFTLVPALIFLILINKIIKKYEHKKN